MSEFNNNRQETIPKRTQYDNHVTGDDLARKVHVSSIIENKKDEENRVSSDSDKLFFRVSKVKFDGEAFELRAPFL